MLDGMRALVTGSARGIGRSIASAMLDNGASVMLADVDAGALSDTAEALGQSDRCRHAAMDVGDEASIARVMSVIEAEWSGLDILINNAAISDLSHTEDVDAERWARVLDINLTSVLRASQAALPLLRRSEHASIVNTASTQALFGQPCSVAYATAKGGLLNLTRCMAIDLGEHGIRVNAVAPGFIDTRMAVMPDGRHEHEQPEFKRLYLEMGRIPLRRPGRAEDCAGAFVFLASPMSGYITGQVITVDGGLSATY